MGNELIQKVMDFYIKIIECKIKKIFIVLIKNITEIRLVKTDVFFFLRKYKLFLKKPVCK